MSSRARGRVGKPSARPFDSGFCFLWPRPQGMCGERFSKHSVADQHTPHLSPCIVRARDIKEFRDSHTPPPAGRPSSRQLPARYFLPPALPLSRPCAQSRWCGEPAAATAHTPNWPGSLSQHRARVLPGTLRTRTCQLRCAQARRPLQPPRTVPRRRERTMAIP